MREISVGIIGDYDPVAKPHHASMNESIVHASDAMEVRVATQWLPTGELEGATDDYLRSFDAWWASSGSPYQSMEGALKAIRFAREHDCPFLGT